jgi:hypothetical protein
MAFFAHHHAPTANPQVSSYATYVAAGTNSTGAMFVGTRSLLGYDQKHDVHADVLEYLDNHNDRDRRRSKPSYYVVEIHENTSNLPQLGDLAMYLPEEPEDEHRLVEHKTKSTSALAVSSSVSTLLSLCLLIMGMAKALATLPNNRNQRKEDLTLMLKVIEGLVTEIACLRSGAAAHFQLSAQILAMLLETQSEIHQRSAAAMNSRIELVKQLRRYNTLNQGAINAFPLATASLAHDDLEGHLTALFRATELEFKNVSVQLKKTTSTTFPRPPNPESKFGIAPDFGGLPTGR